MEILVADENRDLEVSGEVWLEMLTQTVTSGVRTGEMKSRLQDGTLQTPTRTGPNTWTCEGDLLDLLEQLER